MCEADDSPSVFTNYVLVTEHLPHFSSQRYIRLHINMWDVGIFFFYHLFLRTIHHKENKFVISKKKKKLNYPIISSLLAVRFYFPLDFACLRCACLSDLSIQFYAIQFTFRSICRQIYLKFRGLLLLFETIRFNVTIG